MLASFLGVLPILTPSLCALAFHKKLDNFYQKQYFMVDLNLTTFTISGLFFIHDGNLQCSFTGITRCLLFLLRFMP
jgi:hypothetical protein